jgi:hypothetical protein
MAHYRHHHHHHFEWWLAPVYACVFMFWACYWILKLYALAFIYAWKGTCWAAPRIAAAWRSWRAGTLGAGVKREPGRF